MKIQLNTSYYSATLEIEEGSAKIAEDISEYESPGVRVIAEEQILQFAEILYRIYEFNRKEPLDMFRDMISEYLDNTDKKTLVEELLEELKING